MDVKHHGYLHLLSVLCVLMMTGILLHAGAKRLKGVRFGTFIGRFQVSDIVAVKGLNGLVEGHHDLRQ